jgi:hypothetical protein
MAQGLMHVTLAPANGVTDLDEWFAQLDQALGIRHDSRWKGDATALKADLPTDEAEHIVTRVRNILGESVETSIHSEDGMIVTDSVAGRPIDE